MNYYFYLAFNDKSGEDINIRISVNSQDRNYLFNKIDELPQYGEEINVDSFRTSRTRRILKSFNKWRLCFPDFKDKRGSFLIIDSSSARLFIGSSCGDNFKRNYDITVKYIEYHKT